VTLRAEAVLASSVGLCVVAVRAFLLDLPLERDEGEYAYIGWRLAHGEIPYLDWFNQKPPAVFWIYRAALALPGDPVVGIRAVAALFSALTSIAMFYLVRPLLGLGAAGFAALLLGLLSADPMIQGPIANSEIFMLPAVVAAAALFVRVVAQSKAAVLQSVGIGVLLGIATAFKQVAGVNAIFFVLIFPCLASAEDRWRRLVRFTSWMTLGALAVWVPLFGWFLLHGAFREALDAILLHNLDYASVVPLSQRLGNLANTARTLAISQGATWLLAGLGLARLTRRGDRSPARFLLGWVAASAVGVSFSGHFFPHYFQQLLPPIAAGAAALIPQSPIWKKASRGIAATLIGVLALGPLLAVTVSFWSISPAEAMKRIYPGNPFEAMPSIGREIAEITKPDDSVFVFGADPEILFYARRVSASRYIHLFPLFGPFPDVAERQKEVIAEISERQPAVIVWIPNAMFLLREEPRLLVPWLDRLTADSYRPHAVIMADHTNRGRIIRMDEHSANTRLAENRAVWARIFVRSDRADRQ
jgi:4-amino-4-deoxy-L-arabinose transferase-like glycosyltransferase